VVIAYVLGFFTETVANDNISNPTATLAQIATASFFVAAGAKRRP
jgi:hypothetical protein